jgi:ATP-dependent DNA helicase PIF1
MGWLRLLLILTLLIYFLERIRLPSSPKTISKLKTKTTPKIYEESKLSLEQENIYRKLEASNKHTFVTGEAGSGKTILLKYFKKHTNKRIVVLAPTGIAAINVEGQTIHSFFNIKPGILEPRSIRLKPETQTILECLDTIVIDEISMVRADTLDAIDFALRRLKRNGAAFGGIQLLMFGDLYQLPPIVSDPALKKYFKLRYGGYFFFNATVWRQTNLEIYQLKKVFRQKGKEFRDILNSIRSGQVNQAVINELNKRAEARLPKDGVVTLAATNKVVDEINKQKLGMIKRKEFIYEGELEGKPDSMSTSERILNLKVGAQVIMTRNDPQKRWFNGSLATIAKLQRESITVKINNNTYDVPRHTWDRLSYSFDQVNNRISQKVSGSITQYPLRLAWAMTIHKAQGQTYKRCAIDLKDGVFAHGQAYVALSRCKSLSGLYLLSPIIPSDISVAPEVIEFMNRAEKLNC